MKTKILYALSLAFLSSHAHAAVLVEYRMPTPRPGLPPISAYDYEDGVTPSTIQSHGSVIHPGNGGTVGGYSTTVDSTNYVGFVLEAEEGQSINLTHFEFYTYVDSSSYPALQGFQWGYRVDNGEGYGQWVFDTQVYTKGTAAFTDIFAKKVWNFADFSTEGSVEFGLFAYQTGTDLSAIELSSRSAPQGLQVHGSVSPIPEPSAALLGAVGGLALFRRRRSR